MTKPISKQKRKSNKRGVIICVKVVLVFVSDWAIMLKNVWEKQNGRKEKTLKF